MAQGSDQGAGAMMGSFSRRSGAAVTAPPPAVAAGTVTLASILTVAGILLLFVVFAGGLLSLQHCFNSWDLRAASGRRRRGRGTTAVGSGDTARGGVDPELLRSLPVTVYRATKDDPSSEDAAAECAVCLAELEDGEEARFLPRCGHGFHAECVDMWLASHSTCPLCRITVGKPPALAPALPPVAPEPADQLATVLLGMSDLRDAVTVATDGGTRRPPTGATGVLVIEIPESAVTIPHDVAKSLGSARLRSIRRLWSFGRQGAGSSSSYSCGGAGDRVGVEQSTSVTIGIAVADKPLPSEAAAETTWPGLLGAIA